jgi:CheY-like chemotaxis protein
MHTKKIMLIDDSKFDIFICSKILTEEAGARHIVEMQSGIEALQYLKFLVNPVDFPDLIFLDIKMPYMSGFEFLEAYANESCPKKLACKIIVMTSLQNNDELEKVKSNRYVTSMLAKPLKIADLSTVLEM